MTVRSLLILLLGYCGGVVATWKSRFSCLIQRRGQEVVGWGQWVVCSEVLCKSIKVQQCDLLRRLSLECDRRPTAWT